MKHGQYLSAGMLLLAMLAIPMGANAQVACPHAVAAGAPPVEAQHIFCGEINSAGKAVGFHSRPGGINPASVRDTGAPKPKPGHPGIYNLSNFHITQNGKTATKTISTMYPDKCSMDDVLTAIRHAWRTGHKDGQQFNGMSGPGCTDANGKEFPIQGFTTPNGGRIRTGYPN